jgi:hypothetical protein
MRRSGTGSGGGIGMNKNVQVPVKTGSGSTGIWPSYTNAPGSQFGDHTTDGKSTGYRGPKREDGKSFQPVPFGNEVALNVGKGGCSTGRTIYKTGSQDMHGQPASGNPPAQGKDVLSQFGPDYKR